MNNEADDSRLAKMTAPELRAEVARMRRLWSKEAEPEFGPFSQEKNGVVSVPVVSAAVHFLIDQMAEMLAKMKATNYVAIDGWHPSVGRIEVTVQRVGALTPHSARVKAERHLARAVALLNEHGIGWDGPTEFLPDEPPRGEMPAGDTPWVKLDVTKTPNQVFCERCGERQSLPFDVKANVVVATINAFNAAHKVCEEGDAEKLSSLRGSLNR